MSLTQGLRVDFESVEPAACRTLAEVRAGVDELDRRMVELLARRQAYAERAAQVKTDHSQVRDERRIAIVVANAVAHGAVVGATAQLVEPIWRHMIETFLVYEGECFEAEHGGGQAAGASRP